METIYKYKLEVTADQTIEMPNGAEMLTVQVQAGIPCLWAKVNTENPVHKYKFKTHGTGHPLDKDFNGLYIGTYQLYNGTLAFHVWQIFDL